MKHLRRIASAALVLAALSAPALAEPALWKVSDADSSIYLFGSVHIFTRDMNWRSAQFNALLKSAQHVYFEVKLDAEAYRDITYITLTEGRFRDHQILGDFLSTEERSRLINACNRAGVDYMTLRHLRPWLAAMQLAPTSDQKLTAGVEMRIEEEVEPARLRALETAAEQMGILADAPMGDQIDGLMAVVDSVLAGTDVTDVDSVVNAWESGDADALAAVMSDDVTPGSKAMHDRLLDERNAKWLPTFEQLLASNDESLIIVGAAHLVGPTGIAALLQSKGYAVERIDAAAADFLPAAGSDPIKPR